LAELGIDVRILSYEREARMTNREYGLMREVRREPQRGERVNHCSNCITISGGIILISFLLK